MFSRSDKSGRSDLYRIEVSEDLESFGEAQRITSIGSAMNPCWTADGSELVFTSYAMPSGPSLWRISASASSEPKQLTFAGEAAYAAIARNSDRLVFQRRLFQSNVWRFETSNSNAETAWEKVISSTRVDHWADLSPDATQIAFVSNRSGSSEIWICDSDGSNCSSIRPVASGGGWAPRWSPAGDRIVYSSQAADGNTDIYLIDLDGGHRTRLTKHPELDSFASWSRDGRWIYFTSERSGATEIWKMSAEGGNPVILTDAGGVGPALESFDGQFLYYGKDTGYTWKGLWRRPVKGGPEARIMAKLPDAPASVQTPRWCFSPERSAITKNGFYFVCAPSLFYLDFTSQELRRIARTDRGISPGLSVYPDGKTILLSLWDLNETDLMLVENFR